ncbi:DUF1674 domain-containing protein [Stenotrophobium rhamnosiphilum]|nr:succinate dehydrogenase assembly factor 4 [Stenotrophobium rhamnosiphilum]
MSSPTKSTVQTYTPPAPAEKAMSLAELLKSEQADATASSSKVTTTTPGVVAEIGGRVDGPEPTRYGDWEKNGRCIDF